MRTAARRDRVYDNSPCYNGYLSLSNESYSYEGGVMPLLLVTENLQVEAAVRIIYAIKHGIVVKIKRPSENDDQFALRPWYSTIEGSLGSLIIIKLIQVTTATACPSSFPHPLGD